MIRRAINTQIAKYTGELKSFACRKSLIYKSRLAALFALCDGLATGLAAIFTVFDDLSFGFLIERYVKALFYLLPLGSSTIIIS